MSLDQLSTIDALRQFLNGTQAVAFSVASNKQDRYRWVQKTLVKHRYLLLSKADKGIVTRYLIKVAGYTLTRRRSVLYASTSNLAR